MEWFVGFVGYALVVCALISSMIGVAELSARVWSISE